MRYLVTLKPLKPFFFGGDITFGELGENSNYLVHSRLFPQQTAILGMIRKEILIQSGLLTTKRQGEWVDDKVSASKLVGDTKFLFNQKQEFGVLKSISPIFLIQEQNRFIKKVNIDSCEYQNDGLLKGYNPKEDIHDNYISIDDETQTKKKSDIFRPIEQIGIKKNSDQEGYFKKTSYLLKDNFEFAFYIELDFELKNSFITLGAEQSMFKMSIKKSTQELNYYDKNGYLTLLSDTYIDIPIKDNCDFAITSEITFSFLENEFKENKRVFKKHKKQYFLYEKGSIFINPTQQLIESINRPNLQKIGYNIFTQGEK